MTRDTRATDAPRPSLLLLHGFMGSADDWSPLRLQDVARVTALDLPGHGLPPQSWPAGGSGFERTLDWLESALRQCGPRPRFLAGYSLGGRLALALALRCPHELDGLILLASSAGLAGNDARTARHRLDEQRARELVQDFPGFLDSWYRQPLFGELRHRPGFPAVLERRLRSDPRELARALVRFSPGKLPVFQEELARLDLPVLLLAGEEDVAYATLSRSLQQQLPRAQRVVLTGVAHALLEEDPAGCAREITRFINQIG